MMNVLLTGASGFIGREVARALVERGFSVHALGRARCDVPEVIHHDVDLLDDVPDLSAFRASRLIHCAWYAESGKFWDAPENLDWVAASLLLARRFAAAGGERLVVAGSCAEYSWDCAVQREDILGSAPSTLYGQSKRALFELLMAAAPGMGLSIGWGRIFIPFGSREDPRRLLGSVIRARRTGKSETFTAGEQVRDFIHVEDVAGALVAILESEVEGGVNLGLGQGVPVREFVARAGMIAGIGDLLHIGARPDRAGDPPSLVADIGRLTNEVGFVPRYTLDTGLTEALAHG